MELKTILNRVQKHRSFVYGKMRLVEKEGAVVIEVQVYPRANSGTNSKRRGAKLS